MEKTIHSTGYAVFLNLLREIRQSSGITQIEVADKLNVTQTFVSKCERGERRIDVIELHAWCSALGITLAEFSIKLEKKFESKHGRSEDWS